MNISILGVAILGLLIGSYFIGILERKEAVNALNNKAEILSHIIQQDLELAYINISESESFLQHLCEKFGKREGIIHVEIFDKNANIIAHTFKDRIGSSPLSIHKDYVFAVFEKNKAIEEIDKKGSRYNLFIPIANQNNTEVISVIELVLEIDSSPLAEIQKEASFMEDVIKMGMSRLFYSIQRSKEHLKKFTLELNELEGVDHLRVYDPQNLQTIYDDSVRHFNLSVKEHIKVIKQVVRSNKAFVDNEKHFGFYPIHSRSGNSNVIAIAELTMDIELMEQSLYQSKINLLVVICLILFFSALLLIVLLRIMVVKPISNMIPYTIDIGKGNFDNFIPVSTKDEIGKLATAFNTMVIQLNGLKHIIENQKYDLLSKNKLLQSSVEEKETLLKEIHHRVKNNLQIISSLMSLQVVNIDNKSAVDLFQSSQFRIKSMAMIHEMLYQSGDFSKISYAAYLKSYLNSLIYSIKSPEQEIKINIDKIDLHLNIDTAIPLGLLINEICMNSLKHGFKNLTKGEITVSIINKSDESYMLYIGDDGCGFDKEVNDKTVESLGLKLIKSLSKQLKGELKRDFSKKGTHYQISFIRINNASM